MAYSKSPAVLVFAAFLFLAFVRSPLLCGEDEKLKPEELVARHLKSIGRPDVLAKIKSRAFEGATTVQFLQGTFGTLAGQSQFASAGHKLGIVMKYNAPDYPGEHFAFDGRSITIARPLAGRISPLADFINQYGGIIKEGLMGGVLNVSWPLLNIEETQPKLKYKKDQISGRWMHVVEYRPKKGLGDFKIVLFFDFETFRHLKTEYRLRIASAMGTGASTTNKELPDSNYLLFESFDDFREVEGMMLPHRYTIGYSAEGQTRTFLAHWILEANQWTHNGVIDEGFFDAD